MIMKLNWLIEKGYFTSRSEAIREAIRNLLKEYNVPDINIEEMMNLSERQTIEINLHEE